MYKTSCLRWIFPRHFFSKIYGSNNRIGWPLFLQKRYLQNQYSHFFTPSSVGVMRLCWLSSRIRFHPCTIVEPEASLTIVCACFCPSKQPCYYQGSKQSQEMAVLSGDSTYLCHMLRYPTVHGRCLWGIPGGNDGCFFGKFGGRCFQGWSGHYQAKELCLVWLRERTGLDERIVAPCRG